MSDDNTAPESIFDALLDLQQCTCPKAYGCRCGFRGAQPAPDYSHIPAIGATVEPLDTAPADSGAVMSRFYPVNFRGDLYLLSPVEVAGLHVALSEEPAMERAASFLDGVGRNICSEVLYLNDVGLGRCWCTAVASQEAAVAAVGKPTPQPAAWYQPSPAPGADDDAEYLREWSAKSAALAGDWRRQAEFKEKDGFFTVEEREQIAAGHEATRDRFARIADRLDAIAAVIIAEVEEIWQNLVDLGEAAPASTAVLVGRMRDRIRGEVTS